MNTLFHQLKSTDSRIRSNAISTIGLLLEKNSLAGGSFDSYENLIPEPYLSIKLTENERGQLIKELGERLITDENEREFIWAIGKAYGSSRPLPYLFQWLAERSATSDLDTLCQTLDCLTRLPWKDEDQNWLPGVSEAMENFGIIRIIKKLAEGSDLGLERHSIQKGNEYQQSEEYQQMLRDSIRTYATSLISAL